MQKKLGYPPVIVLGQPRSGSTLLVNVLNESDDYIFIDDLYALQYIDANNLWEATSAEAGKSIAQYAFSFIARRMIHQTRPGPDGRPEKIIRLKKEHVQEISTYLSEANYDGFRWYQVIDDLMSTVATVTGARGWGYKTPQDFLHLDRLATAFPEAVFIFILRDPRAVLASYKNRARRTHDPDRGGDDPRRYNPYLQSLAWKLAASAALKAQARMPERTLATTYEDLVRNPDTVMQKIAAILKTTFPPIDLEQYGKNTSFKDKSKAVNVTDTEVWISDLVVGDIRQKFGYDYDKPSLNVSEIGHVGSIFLTSLTYYLSRGITSPNIRKRVLRVFQSAVVGR